MDEFTPDAWEAILAEYTYEECLTALRETVRYQAFVAPADIVGRVERARGERRAARSLPGAFGVGCGRPGCDCTHTYPCDRGFTESQIDPDKVAWCGRCWPERQPAPEESAEAWMRRIQQGKSLPDKATADA